MKNRKLFPELPETNQTTDCSGICEPACPYNCYSYPDYYYLSPPPPPPQPPLSDHNHYIPPYVIILASVLASLFLLIGYYVIVVKSCYGWCWSRNNRQAQAQTDGSDDEFLDENRGDHPIWFITTVGLQQSIINSITICKYKKGEGLIEGTECSVCLNEFQEEETVRLLPKCNHAFHISCIDTWLRAHTNCPLCRAHIVFDSVRAPPTSADQNPNSMELADESRIENVDFEGELSGQNQGRSSEVCENRAITDSGNELVEANEQRISKDRIHSDENGVTKEMQLMKRCVSMDSSTAARFLFGFANLYPLRSEGSYSGGQENVENSHSSIIQKQGEGNSSIDQHLHLSSVPMKRSFSCSGRFFSSKRSRSMNSNLPL